MPATEELDEDDLRCGAELFWRSPGRMATLALYFVLLAVAAQLGFRVTSAHLAAGSISVLEHWMTLACLSFLLARYALLVWRPLLAAAGS